MKQSVTLRVPVLKTDGSGPITAGEAVHLILKDGSQTVVYLTDVSRKGRRISWDLAGVQVIPTITSSQNATTVASDDTTGDALANALKTSFNAAQVDIAAAFAAYKALTLTSSQNGTTAASSDGTRLTLANALRTSLNALIADIATYFAANEALGEPTSETVTTPIGSDDPTTQTLLNALKIAYNAAQVDIAEIFTKIDTGYFIPREGDVVGVDGIHQIEQTTADIHSVMDNTHGDSDLPAVQQ